MAKLNTELEVPPAKHGHEKSDDDEHYDDPVAARGANLLNQAKANIKSRKESPVTQPASPEVHKQKSLVESVLSSFGLSIGQAANSLYMGTGEDSSKLGNEYMAVDEGKGEEEGSGSEGAQPISAAASASKRTKGMPKEMDPELTTVKPKAPSQTQFKPVVASSQKKLPRVENIRIGDLSSGPVKGNHSSRSDDDGRVQKRARTNPTRSARPTRAAKMPDSFRENSSVPTNQSELDGVTNSPGKDSGITPKRGRGRPKKIASPIEVASEQNKDAHPSDMEGILDGPTPIKPTLLAIKPAAPPVRTSRRETTGQNDDRQSIADRERTITASSPPRTQRVRGSAETFQFDHKSGEMMLTMVRRIGHKHREKDDSWTNVRTGKKSFRSASSKQLRERLELLDSAYGNLQKLQDAGDDVEEAEGQITEHMVSLKEEVEGVLGDRLGNPKNNVQDSEKKSPELIEAEKENHQKMTRRILTDIYYDLIPLFVEVIKKGVETRDQDSIKSYSLQELAELIDHLCKLSEAGFEHIKELQPKELYNYPTKRSIQRMLAIARPLRKQFLEEIKTRKSIRDRVARRRAADREEEQRLVDEEIEKAELRRRIKNVHKRQRETLLRQQSDPVLGRLVEAELARLADLEAWNSSQRYRERTVSSPSPLQSQEEVEEDGDEDGNEDGNEDDDGEGDDNESQIERVYVFGQRKNPKFALRDTLTSTEKTTFIGIMQDGEANRYEKAAEALKCSLDEVFEIAKNLQAALDKEHENGRMNSVDDEWSYEVWVKSRHEERLGEEEGEEEMGGDELFSKADELAAGVSE